MICIPIERTINHQVYVDKCREFKAKLMRLRIIRLNKSLKKNGCAPLAVPPVYHK